MKVFSKLSRLLVIVFMSITSVSARVYLPQERFFTQSTCAPRTFCSIIKDYFLTEPQLIRGIVNPYQRLNEEKKILETSNNFSLMLGFNSSITENKSDTYWTTYDGLGVQYGNSTNNFMNIWMLNGRWQPFNLSGKNDREETVTSEIQSYFYLARLEVFNKLNIFLALRSPDNIIGVIDSSRALEYLTTSIPILNKLFKDETFLYTQKLVSMDKLLSIYDGYNDALTKKISLYNRIHFYNPAYFRLKNLVLNSIDAITLEFSDFVEEHLDLKNFKVCSKKAYLEEAVKRKIFNLKVAFQEGVERYKDNLSGFNFRLSGELNEPMNFMLSYGINLSYQVFETSDQKLAKWDYVVARKTISDNFTKSIELEEDFLNETFLMTQANLENYLQSKHSREQIYLILKGKVVNKLGDKNFKFGFSEITERALNLRRVLESELRLASSLFSYSNALFVGLSQCALSEEIIEEIQNL